MTSGKSIVFVINSLTAGGAERALMQLLFCMEDRLQGCAAHLVLLDVEEERHAVPAWVRKHVLDAKHNFFKSAILLTRLLKGLAPAVTLSFLNRSNCANVISSGIIKSPCIISERVHTTTHLGRGLAATINKAIVRLTYRLADQVIAVSEGVRDDLVTNFGLSGRKVCVIHNPVDIDLLRAEAAQRPKIALSEPYILGIGRLVPNKNFRLLIEAYGASGSSEKLVILGEGEERPNLERLIARLGLSERVLLPGHVRNPYPIIKAARLFVSSSNAEGFPNALVEAMALGCPVVATDCETGPCEILAGAGRARCEEIMFAKYGILVPTNSVESLTQAIRVALQPNIGTAYSRIGTERARDFGVDRSVEQYWSAITPYLSAAKVIAK